MNGKAALDALLSFFLLLSMVAVTTCYAVKPYPATYYKVTMQAPDGHQRVFMGRSVSWVNGTVHYVRKSGEKSWFTGTFWVEKIGSQTYHDFKPPAEEAK